MLKKTKPNNKLISTEKNAIAYNIKWLALKTLYEIPLGIEFVYFYSEYDNNLSIMEVHIEVNKCLMDEDK